MNFPVGVGYNHHKGQLLFFLIEANFQGIRRQQEEIDFENVLEKIHILEESFHEKVFSVEPFVNFKEIYSEVESVGEILKVVFTESIFNLNSARKKLFFINILFSSPEEESYLKIYRLEFTLNQDSKQRLFYETKLEKLNCFQSQEQIWGLRYFKEEGYFQLDNPFKSNQETDRSLISLTKNKQL